MKRKLIAAAVGAALAAPGAALAAAELFGRVNLGLDQYSATGATNGAAKDYQSRMRVFDSSSRLGVRGSEDLGAGLKVVYAIETGVAVDTGSGSSQGSAPNGSAGFLATRYGYGGLAGSFGQVTFGRHNTWWGSGVNQPFQSTYVNAAGQMDSGNFGRGMGPGVARLSNSIQYTSPKIGPAEIVATYSPSGETQGANAPTNGNVKAVTVQGAVGPMSFALDWTSNVGNDPTPPSVTPPTKRTGTKLRGGYEYQPGARLSLVWVKATVDKGVLQTGAGLDAGVSMGVPETGSLSQSGFQVNWEHTVGNINIIAQFQKIGDISGCVAAANCADTNNRGIMAGARFLQTKNTWMYLTYNAYTNARQYNADYSSGGQSSIAAGAGTTAIRVPLGVDPKIIAFGVSHTF